MIFYLKSFSSFTSLVSLEILWLFLICHFLVVRLPIASESCILEIRLYMRKKFEISRVSFLFCKVCLVAFFVETTLMFLFFYYLVMVSIFLPLSFFFSSYETTKSEPSFRNSFAGQESSHFIEVDCILFVYCSFHLSFVLSSPPHRISFLMSLSMVATMAIILFGCGKGL